MDPLVKIAFVMDCTGSMERWIHQAKTKIQDIIDKTRQDNPQARFQVAFVGYRDYGDTTRFHTVDFTSPNQLVSEIRDIRAEGGDDEAEDVAGALRCAVNLTWHPSNVRMLFHIADAPAHGERYHSIRVSDRFPRGDPEGFDPRDFLNTLVRDRVDYTFVRITPRTDTMIEVFHDLYKRMDGVFTIIDLHPQTYDGRYGAFDGDMSAAFLPSISGLVSRRVTQHISSQDM